MDLSTAELLRKSDLLTSKLKIGTSTKEDKEEFVVVTATIECSSLDTATLLSKSAAIADKLKTGTATKEDKLRSAVLLDAAKRQKEAVSEIPELSTATLIKRNADLVKGLTAGTATRADKEKFAATLKVLDSRKETESKIKTATTEMLLKRHEALAKSLKTGTATRAEKEELAAVMKCEEELKKKARELESVETKRKLAAAKHSLLLTEKRTEIKGVMKLVKASEKMDLVFMVDATGSMGSQIANVKDQVVKMVGMVTASNPSLKLRVGAVFYRDAQDGDGGNSSLPFVEDAAAFKAQVATISAHGGGDGAEDVASGLRDVMRLAWASPSRVLIHIADAPSHGDRYHDGCDDHHTAGDHGIPKLLTQIRQMNVDYVFGRMNAGTDKMIRVFNADAGGGAEPWIKTAPMTSAAELTTCATATMRTTMHKTFSRLSAKASSSKPGGSSRGTGTGLPSAIEEEEERSFTLTAAEPDWGSEPALHAEVYSNEPLGDVKTLGDASKGTLGWIKAKAGALFGLVAGGGGDKAAAAAATKAAAVKVAPQPFAEGNLRFARKGKLQLCGGSSWVDVVLKDFKRKKCDADKEAYLRDMESVTVAGALAKAFNDKHAPPAASRIRYVESPVLCVKGSVKWDGGSSGGGAAAEERCFFVEEVLRGSFTKYSNNLGFWNPDTLDEWLLRFSLWTFEATAGHMMVVDLQGVRGADGYVLTDPVILCGDEMRFGSTNMGVEAMERVKASATAHLAELLKPAAAA